MKDGESTERRFVIKQSVVSMISKISCLTTLASDKSKKHSILDLMSGLAYPPESKNFSSASWPLAANILIIASCSGGAISIIGWEGCSRARRSIHAAKGEFTKSIRSDGLLYNLPGLLLTAGPAVSSAVADTNGSTICSEVAALRALKSSEVG